MIMRIGGLLVSVLLSSTSAEPIDKQADAYCFTYELHIPSKNAKSGLAVNKEKPHLLKIDELIGAISSQTRNLKNLLKEKTSVIDKLQTLLDFRAYTRKPLNEFQLNSFTRFTGFYNQEAGALQNTLRKIDADKELMTAKKELLHKEANFIAIIDELTSFSNSLDDAASYLRSIIELGNSTLQVL